MKLSNVIGTAFCAMGALAYAVPASASTNLSAFGALGFATSNNSGYDTLAPSFGGEVTFGFAGMFDLGGFYEQTRFSGSDASIANGTANFWGGVFRVNFMNPNFFVDTRLGSNKNSYSNGTSNDSAFGYEFGLGYNVTLGPALSLKPRIAYKNLPFGFANTTVSHSFIEGGVMLTLSLL